MTICHFLSRIDPTRLATPKSISVDFPGSTCCMFSARVSSNYAPMRVEAEYVSIYLTGFKAVALDTTVGIKCSTVRTTQPTAPDRRRHAHCNAAAQYNNIADKQHTPVSTLYGEHSR